MKKTGASTKADSKTVKAARDSEQQTEDERYESMLFRIRASLAACRMITEDLNALYKELKAFQENHQPGGAK